MQHNEPVNLTGETYLWCKSKVRSPGCTTNVEDANGE